MLRKMLRKTWKKVIRMIILTGIAAVLGNTPSYGATVAMEDTYVEAVEQALVNGDAGKAICSQTFADKQSVYDLLRYTCQNIDEPSVFLKNQCLVDYKIATLRDGSGYYLSAEIDRYEKYNDLDTDAITKALLLDGRSDLEIAIIVHNWLTSRLEYADSESSLSTCLKRGKGKCDDYSMIYAAIMNAAGIETRCMAGVPIGSNAGHMWNMVCIDGLWYVCDVTWDDSNSNYDFFLKALQSPAIQECYGMYLYGYCAGNGLDGFFSYPMATTDFPVCKIVKCLMKPTVIVAVNNSVAKSL